VRMSRASRYKAELSEQDLGLGHQGAGTSRSPVASAAVACFRYSLICAAVFSSWSFSLRDAFRLRSVAAMESAVWRFEVVGVAGGELTDALTAGASAGGCWAGAAGGFLCLTGGLGHRCGWRAGIGAGRGVWLEP